MRVETAGARTWLLGAVALWALCVWVLALFGLGGGVARLDDDPTLAGRLPQPGTAAAERLGPLQQYAAIGERPLFTDDRHPQPFFINPEGEDGEKPASFDFVLTSVLRTPDFQMAILRPADGNGEAIRLKVDQAPKSAPAWRLVSLDARSAVFNGPEGERKLELRVFDGNGGEPPTAMTVQNPAQPVIRQPVAVPRSAQPGGSPQTSPVPPPPDAAAAANPAANANAADAAAPEASAAEDQAAQQQQIENIRKRIEARRAKLRQEAQQPPQAPP